MCISYFLYLDVTSEQFLVDSFSPIPGCLVKISATNSFCMVLDGWCITFQKSFGLVFNLVFNLLWDWMLFDLLDDMSCVLIGEVGGFLY